MKRLQAPTLLTRYSSSLFASYWTLLLVFFTFTPNCSAENLASFDSGKLNFTLQSSSESFTLEVRPTGGLASLQSDLTANAFAITGPSRLVVDIPNISSTKNAKIPLTGSKEVKQMRVGAHPDKTRVVIDIKGTPEIDYSVTSDPVKEALLVHFSLNGKVISPPPSPTEATSISKEAPKQEAKEPIKEIKKETVAELQPKEAKPELDSESAELLNKSVQAAESEPTNKIKKVAPTPIQGTTKLNDPSSKLSVTSTPLPKVTDDKTKVVKGLFFRSKKGSAAASVMIDVDKLATYELKRKSSILFELSLKDAKLAGKHLLLPQFPPDSFGGLEVLVARQVGSKVKIKIYVTEGTSLEPYISENKLWLRTSSEEL